MDWLNKVPKEFNVVRVKDIGDAFIGLTYSPDDIISDDSVFNKNIVLRSTNIQNGKISLHDNVFVSKDIPEKLILNKDDLLICSRNGSKKLVGKCALIDDKSKGLTFGAFTTVFRSEHNKYFYYVMQSSMLDYYSNASSTTTINQITTGMLNAYKFALPASKKQEHEIVSFLDKKCSSIDSKIELLTQKLHHLEEYKTALIHNAVTKGLDANGNEITNSEWKSRSVKSLFHTATRGKNCTYSDNDNENLIITQSCLLQDNTLDVSKGKFEVNSPSGEKFHLSNGDILISSSGVKNTIGKVAYIEGINKTTIANWDVMRLCTNTDMHSKYTYYLLITMRNHIKEYCLRGATGQEHLIADFFNESTVCVPKVADQETISKFLDIEVTNLNIIKKKINKKIALLLEYKKSLINEAVSGQ